MNKNKNTYSTSDIKQMNFSMRLSLAVGFFMLIMKSYAYHITGSAAILSDAAESVVHILAVAFAVYSMWLSLKPADQDHIYGHDRITFFSAGFEGAMIILAALYIIYEAIYKWMHGLQLENIDEGMLFIALATLINGALGIFLLYQGKKFRSLVLEADGKHILTDCLTSLGVIIALILTRITHWMPFDPIIALLVALNILWTGTKLVRNSIGGLMDKTNPQTDKKIRAILQRQVDKYQIEYHHLRHRNAGNRLIIEVHLLFPKHLSIAEAHEIATLIEKDVEQLIDQPTELITHLEPIEGHDEIHQQVLGHEG